jgi:hypothetical protein
VILIVDPKQDEDEEEIFSNFIFSNVKMLYFQNFVVAETERAGLVQAVVAVQVFELSAEIWL